MKFNTDLVEAQWLPFNAKIITGIRKLQERTNWRAQYLDKCPLPTPPDPWPTKAPFYDTVAGLHGIHYKGPYVKCEPGAIYRVTVDCRVDKAGGAKVFTKGFIDQTRQTTEGVQTLKRNAYRAPLSLHGLSTRWHRFSRVLNPARTKSTYGAKPVLPEWLQVQLYSYWPPDNYYWDNVKLEIIGYEEIGNPDAGDDPKEIELKMEKLKTMDGDFPVF